MTHLNDVVLAMPVFAAGTLVAWAANIGHWNDVGGSVPGSMAIDARDIFAEGLRLPAIKLFEAGRPIEQILKIMTANSRLPEFLLGDLWAAVASVRRGAERVARVVATYGLETLERALAEYYDYAERQARDGLRRLPRGRLALAEPMDDGTVWRAAIEIADEAFTVDLREAPDQRGDPLNTSRDGALVAAQLIFKAATAADSVCNAGSFRPLRLLTRPGSIFDPLEPAAQGYYFEVRARLSDMLWRGLAQAAPDRFPAGHFASICGTVIAGRHPATGRRFAMVEPQMGGWGATATRDGNSAMFSSSHGETFNCPVEIAEARYGFAFRRLALNDEPGGEGRHCGGRGLVKEFAIGGTATELSAGYSRHRQRVLGPRRRIVRDDQPDRNRSPRRCAREPRAGVRPRARGGGCRAGRDGARRRLGRTGFGRRVTAERRGQHSPQRKRASSLADSSGLRSRLNASTNRPFASIR